MIVHCVIPHIRNILGSDYDIRFAHMNLLGHWVKLLCFFLTEHHAVKAYWGSGGIPALIL
jgi:hypothetical protein